MADVKRAEVPEFNPSVTLLVKLGSIAVHADEMLGPTGHRFDRTVLEQLLRDPEVTEWIAAMDKIAMLPKKRTAEDATLRQRDVRNPALRPRPTHLTKRDLKGR